MPSLKEKIAAAQDALNEVAIAAAAEPQPLPISSTPLPPDALGVLKALDEWAEHQTWRGIEVKKLWNILAAMRGPDNVGDDKANTTSLIRARALPHMAYGAGMDVASSVYATDDRMAQLANYSSGTNHFSNHIRSAARALLNKDPNE
jgi:hypothetical protein